MNWTRFQRLTLTLPFVMASFSSGIFGDSFDANSMKGPHLIEAAAPGRGVRTLKELQSHVRAYATQVRGCESPCALSKEVIVIIPEGDYFLENGFSLGAEDSIPGGTVKWMAAPGKRVRFLGARKLDRASGKQLSAKRWTFDLSRMGISKWGRMAAQGFRLPTQPFQSEVFRGGIPLQPARHPNTGWLTLDESPAGEKGSQVKLREKVSFKVTPDTFLYGYWKYDWQDQYVRVAGYNASKRTATLEAPLPFYGMAKGQRLSLYNAIEYLDAPGEYLITPSGILHLVPPKNDPNLTQEYFLSLTEFPLIRMVGASGQILSGIEIGYTRGLAIEIQGGAGNEVSSSFVRNTGLEGIAVRGGKGHRISGNRFLDIGSEAVYIEGGDRPSLTRAQHLVDNNEFRRFSRINRTYHPAIDVQGVGILISRNDIAQGPHFAIRFHGNDHVIQLNHIREVVRDTSDAGAIYIGRDWSMRGTVIRYNYIHDVGSNLGGVGSMGVYFDDLASGNTIQGNLFKNAGRCAFIGGGRDNRVEGNVFIDCKNSVFNDRRGKTWKIDWMNDPNAMMLAKLQAVRHDEPPYSTRYPRLATILRDDPLEPRGNEVFSNLMLSSPLSLEGPVSTGDNVNPYSFKDWELSNPSDFRKFFEHFADDLPQGFKAIPYDHIGTDDSDPRRQELLKRFGR